MVPRPRLLLTGLRRLWRLAGLKHHEQGAGGRGPTTSCCAVSPTLSPHFIFPNTSSSLSDRKKLRLMGMAQIHTAPAVTPRSAPLDTAFSQSGP